MPFAPRRVGPAAARVNDADAALAARVAAGDGAALDAIYRRDAGAVYRYAMALAGNPAWAADATQEAFVTFAQHPLGFDAALGSLGAYLAGMARHRLMRLAREAPASFPDEGEGESGGIDAVDPESLLVARQEADALWAALRSLPWPQREAVVLVDLQQRPYAEAAAIAGVELNTLRTRLHRARLRLAAVLAPSHADRPNGDPT